MAKPQTVNEYFETAEPAVREILEQVRATLLQAVPGAEECLRYDMPAIMLGEGRYALHYAGWKQHLGLYPVATLDEPLESEVAPFRAKKDSVNFRYRDGVPLDLVGKIGAALAARHHGA